MKGSNKIASLMAKMANEFGGGVQDIMNRVDKWEPSKQQMKKFKPRMYKSFTSGFRRTMEAPGRIPAPTLDQVRHIERQYKVRLHVKQGLMYFKSDGQLFTHAEGANRLA